MSVETTDILTERTCFRWTSDNASLLTWYRQIQVQCRSCNTIHTRTMLATEVLQVIRYFLQ